MARIVDILRTPFAFLFTRPQKEDIVANYVVREHHRGRSLAEILDDPYVTNRLSTEQAARLLDRPEVVHAVGEDTVAALRSEL